MKQGVLFWLVFLSLSTFAQWPEEDSRIPNQWIVMLQPGADAKVLQRAVPELKLKRNLSQRMNIWLVEADETTASENVLLAIQQTGIVKKAQFNHRIAQRSLIPNDSYFNLQWNMLNTGQNGGTLGADIHATEAWALNHNNVTANGDTIVVAVIDGTFDLNHEDINFFRNHKEVPDNGIDDDANGFIDDYEGWNAYDNSGKINKGGTDPHAMHVAGITGAKGNDSIGVAGTCWGVKILRIAGSSTTESDVVASYDYAIAMRNLYNQTAGAKGAFIVATNSSFGVDNGNPVDFPIWCALYDTMGALGILSSTATANRPQDVDVQHDIPTECPSKWLISVTNTTVIDRLNQGAAYGKLSIDMGAPGTSIYSTYASNGYGYRTGTSMASPHIAGGVAAMYAAACPKLLNDYAAYPDSVASVVKEMLLDGADQLSDLYNKTVTGGRMNLFHALKNLDEYNCSDCNYVIRDSVGKTSCSNSCDGFIQLSVTGNSTYSYNWGSGFGNISRMQDLCPGFYSVTVKDGSGCLQTRNVSLARPDSIVIAAISTVPASGTNPGNIIVAASAGNYDLEYSLNDITYQQAATLVVPVNGSYTVYVRNETGCVVQRSVVLSGLNDVTNVLDWNLYPNPSQETLRVTVSTSGNSEGSFSVLNLLGQTLWEERREMAGGTHTLTIDVSKLAPGSYFLQINTGGTAQSKMFVVQR